MSPHSPTISPITRDPRLVGWAFSPQSLDLVASNAGQATAGTPIRICACCAGNAVPADSAWSPLFCTWCGTRIIAFNRSVGRLVVPVARDPAANCSLFPLTEANTTADGDEIRCYTPDLTRQLEHLDTWRRVRTRELVKRFGLSRRGPVDLTDFLMWSACIQSPAFRWEAKFVALLDWFAEYLLDTPDTSSALRARIDVAARDHVSGFSDRAREKVHAAPEHRLASMAGRWARELVDDVLPLPPVIDRDAPALEARRAPTRRALQAALVREVDRIWKRFSRPPQPIPMNIECPQVYFGVFATPPAHADRPEWLPTKCPRGARLVCAIEDLPAPLAHPVTRFRLSLDSRHRFWILWAEWTAAEGADVTAPAAFGPRGGLKEVEAAHLMLEGFLGKLREQGALPEAPRLALTGMLGETLAAFLLRTLWGT